jgi:hypothetical protein
LSADSANTIHKALPLLTTHVFTMSFDSRTQSIYGHHQSIWLKNLVMSDLTKEEDSDDSFIVNGRNLRALVFVMLFPLFAAYGDIFEDSTWTKVDDADGSEFKHDWPVCRRFLSTVLFCMNLVGQGSWRS